MTLIWQKLTTALLSGSWGPAISRSFHYWQPAPRLRMLPWLANPGKPAMIPQALKGRQAPVTLIKQWKRQSGGGREGGKQKLPGSKKLLCKCWLGLLSKNVTYSVSMWNSGTCAQRDTAGRGATLAFFVVNFVTCI